MAATPLPDGPVEVVRAFIKAAAFDRDEEAAKALLTEESIQGGNFSPPPDAAQMTYDYGEVTQANGEWTVPVTITNPSDPNQSPFTTPFAPVQIEGRWKIDMIKTMNRLMGGNMQAVMDQMTDAMKGIGDAMAQGLSKVFDGVGEALGGGGAGPLNVLPPDASPPFKAVFEKFTTELAKQMGVMEQSLGAVVEVHVDWGSFNNDAEAARHVIYKVLHPIRAAVCLSSGEEKLAEGLRNNFRAFVVRHVDRPEEKSIAVNDGHVQVNACLLPAAGAAGHFTAADIMQALRDALDTEKGPAIDRLLTEVVPQLRGQLREHLDLDLDIDIDLVGFTEPFDATTAVRHLEKLESDVFRNFIYVVREVNEKVPLQGVCEGFRFEHVAAAAHRAAFAWRRSIVIRMSFVEDAGSYHASDLEAILPGVAASLPDFSDKAAREAGSPPSMSPQADAFTLIGDYRDCNFPEQSAAIQQAAGKGLDIEVDWASIGDDAVAADQLRIWGLNRVCGAVRLVVRDQQAQQDLMDTLTGVRLVCVGGVEEKSAQIAAGVLTLHLCLAEGERGCHYETDIARVIIDAMGTELKPMLAHIRSAAEYWERELQNEWDAPVKYHIDFAGFTSSPQDTRNRFALTLLKEHGVDAIYYAVTGLLEKNPNFRQQFRQRVRRFDIMHVAHPAMKSISSVDDALVYRLFLHEGYKGYLTIDDLRKKLPALVAEMADPAAAGHSAAGSAAADRAMTSEYPQAARLPAREAAQRRDDDRPDAHGGEEATAAQDDDVTWQQLFHQAQMTLPLYAQQFAAFLGKAIPVEVDWHSVDGDSEALVSLMNVCLAPIIGGLMTAGQDPTYRQGITKYVDRIVLRRVHEPGDQAIRLDEGSLIMAAHLDGGEPPQVSHEDAATIFKGMIDYVMASKGDASGT